MKTRYMVYIGTILSALSLQSTTVSADETKENKNQSVQTSESAFTIQNQESNFKTDVNDKGSFARTSSTNYGGINSRNNNVNSENSAQNSINTNNRAIIYNQEVQTENNQQIDTHNSISSKKVSNTSSSNIINASSDNSEKTISYSKSQNNADNKYFDQMLQSWKDVTVGDQFYNSSNNEMNQIATQQDKNVKDLWVNMDKSSGRKNLWNGAEELTTSAHITTDYRNLEALAIATSNPGSQYYNNTELIRDVVDGFEWLNTNKYNQNIKSYGNWWDWEIGTPLFINNIVTVMKPHLTEEQIQNSMDAINFFVPDPDYFRGSIYPQWKAEATGANQVDISKVKIIQALIEKDEVGLKKAINAMEKVFPIVTSGEGFYPDGSFIQHENVGYNGSYGNVLMDGVSQLLGVLSNTPYNLSSDSMNSIDFWVDRGFSPFIYKGNLMDMVRGRAISRGTFQSKVAAADLIRSLTRVVDTYQNPEKTKFQSLIKYWLSFGNNYQDYLNQMTNYRDVALIENIMNDSSIEAKDYQDNELYNFKSMDKVLLKNKEHNYAVGITMSSNRIKRYESLNNENTHGWYTGDGMVFIYNDDANQFNDNYWATIDPQKLPGTTETTAPQKIGSGTTTSSKSFVGASTFGNIGALGNVGSVAMDFVNNDNNLTAHKSWFLMKNGVAALGSNIQNNSSYKAFTYIDNRKLNDSSNYKVYVNGGIIQTPLNKISELRNVYSIYLESSVPGESIGYKFITPQDINLGLVERKGAWSEINKAQSRNEYLRKYLEIYREHTSKNDTYNYVTYPNIDLNNFNRINTPTIVKNNDDVQALKFDNNVGVNVFNNTDETIEDMSFSTPLSLTRINNGNQIILGLSDPSQNSKKESSFKLKDNGLKIMHKSQSIQAKLVDGYWNISLKENGHDGNTQILVLRK